MQGCRCKIYRRPLLRRSRVSSQLLRLMFCESHARLLMHLYKRDAEFARRSCVANLALEASSFAIKVDRSNWPTMERTRGTATIFKGTKLTTVIKASECNKRSMHNYHYNVVRKSYGFLFQLRLLKVGNHLSRGWLPSWRC